MFFSSIKSKFNLAMAAMAAMACNFGGILPPEPVALAHPGRRHPKNRALPRARQPDFVKTYDGGLVRGDNHSPSCGTPGSKLARKAAEGRIGLRK